MWTKYDAREVADNVTTWLEWCGIPTVARSDRVSGTTIYLDFKDPELGQLRISDRAGDEGLRCRWHLRADIEQKHTKMGEYRQYIYPTGNVMSLVLHMVNYQRVIDENRQRERGVT